MGKRVLDMTSQLFTKGFYNKFIRMLRQKKRRILILCFLYPKTTRWTCDSVRRIWLDKKLHLLNKHAATNCNQKRTSFAQLVVVLVDSHAHCEGDRASTAWKTRLCWGVFIRLWGPVPFGTTPSWCASGQGRLALRAHSHAPSIRLLSARFGRV